MSSILFIDTESTGIRTKDNPDFTPKLVSLAAILDVDGVTRGVVHLIAEQDEPIPQAAVDIHKITTELTYTAGVDMGAVDMVASKLLLRADLIVAHNYDYDADVIRNSLANAGRLLDSVRKPAFCTQSSNIDRLKLPKDPNREYWTADGVKQHDRYKYPSLAETYRHYMGEELIGWHDALADAAACRAVYYKMKEGGLIPAVAVSAHDAGSA